MSEHGTASRYQAGCRCDACKAAQRERVAAYRAKKRNAPAAPRATVAEDDTQNQSRKYGVAGEYTRENPRTAGTVTVRGARSPLPQSQPVMGRVIDDDEYTSLSLEERTDAVIDAWGYGAPGQAGISQPEASRRVLVTDDRDTVIGSVALRLADRRARRKSQQEYSCMYCGIRVREMYRVNSPAMPGERVLCYRHMLTEFSIPGASVERLS